MLKHHCFLRVVALLAALGLAAGIAACGPKSEPVPEPVRRPRPARAPAAPATPAVPEPDGTATAPESTTTQTLTWADLEKLGPVTELTVGAQEYRNLQWLRIDADGVTFRHAGGEATVPLARLQAALQDRPAPPPAEPAAPAVEPPPAPPAPIVITPQLREGFEKQYPLFAAGEAVEAFRRGIGTRGTYGGTSNQTMSLTTEAGETIEIPLAELDAATRLRVDTEYREKMMQSLAARLAARQARAAAAAATNALPPGVTNALPALPTRTP